MLNIFRKCAEICILAEENIARLLFQSTRREKLRLILNAFGVVIMIMGIITSVRMNMVNRSLWLDEAALAYSFSKRSIFELTSGAFEWNQSAPVIYLYIVKILTLLFGNTEFVLRSLSIVSYAVVLLLTGVISKRMFNSPYPFLCAAFVANMPFVLQYSNVFKQYMFEGAITLLIIYIYYLYINRKVSWISVAILFAIFVWAANPACFFIGGILLVEFFGGIKHKDRKRILSAVLIGVSAVLSFAIYYIYWLRAVAESDAMQNYWVDYAFPFIPTSKGDLKKGWSLISSLFSNFGTAYMVVLLFCIVGFVVGIVSKRNKYCLAILLSMLLCLFASSIHMFPVYNRLWCFSFPIIALVAFFGISENIFCKASGICSFASVFLMIYLVVSNNGIDRYSEERNVYWSGQEVNLCIDYIEDNLDDGEKVYVYYQTIPAARYRIGYENNVMGHGTAENIVWGTLSVSEDANAVLQLDKCFILWSHNPDRMQPMLETLAENGNLELVQDLYNTPLYFYSSSVDNMKTDVECSVVEAQENGETVTVKVRIHNTGDAYLNSKYDDVELACKSDDAICVDISKNVKPGNYTDIVIELPCNDTGEYELQLRNGDRYWFDELGVETITVNLTK